MYFPAVSVGVGEKGRKKGRYGNVRNRTIRICRGLTARRFSAAQPVGRQRDKSPPKENRPESCPRAVKKAIYQWAFPQSQYLYCSMPNSFQKKTLILKKNPKMPPLWQEQEQLASGDRSALHRSQR